MRTTIALATLASLGVIAVPGAAVADDPVTLPKITVTLPAQLPDVSTPAEVAGIPVPVTVTRAAPQSPSPAASTPETGAGSAAPASSGAAPANPARPRTARPRGTAQTRPAIRAARGAGAETPAGSATSATPARTPARPSSLGASGPQPRGHVAAARHPVAAGGSLPLPLPVPDWSKPIILALLLGMIALGIRSSLAARRARRLERQRRALADDLGLLQAALVPEMPDRVADLDVSVAYRPADGPAAGGDFYDVFELPGDQVAIIVGDTSGHGREAVSRAALMRYTLRAYIGAGLSPRAAIELAGRVTTSEDDHFTTVVVAVHDAARGTLSYATAGHPAPILVGPAPFESPVACTASPVGWGVPTGRRCTTVPFPAGAVACFFTDGLTEARSADAMVGRAGLADVLASLGEAPRAEDVIGRVEAQTDPAGDDMAACVVRARAGAAETAARVEEVELDSADLAESRAGRFLHACGLPPSQITVALSEARSVAASWESAIVRVTIAPDSAWAAVTAPGAATDEEWTTVSAAAQGSVHVFGLSPSG